MELNLKINGNVIVVYLNGRFDIHFTKQFEDEIIKLISKDTSSHLVFNLKGAEYVNSSALALFISITKIFKERRRRFILCNIQGSVKKILEVVELTSLFHILKTEEEALEYILNEDLIHSL